MQLVTAQDAIAKMAYTIANPTVAGLVEAPEQWPGVIAWCGRDRNFSARKPADFFASAGPLPESINVELRRPAMLENLPDHEFSRRLDAEVEKLIRHARQDLVRRGLTIVGPEVVRNQAFTARPSTDATRRDLNPTVATRSARARVHALARKGDFARAYRQALQRFRTGTRDVKFPRGTYALRLNVAVEVGKK